MHKHWIKIGILCAGCSLAMSFCTFAQETTVKTAVEEQAQDAETESEKETEEAPEEVFEIQIGDKKTLRILNKTGRKADSFYVKKASKDTWETNLLEEEEQPELKEDLVYDLKLEDDQDEELIIFNLKFSSMDKLEIYEKNGASYVIYHDMETDKDVSTEEYAVHAEEEPLTGYTTSRLNVRELPDTREKVLEVLPLGQKVTIFGRAGEWYLVRSGDGYGYISGDYVTDDKEKADALLAQAKAAAQAAAQAQAVGQTSAQQSDAEIEQETQEPEAQAPEQIYEVSRENIPGCDDPDHGVTYITYSDGSVEAIEY